MPEHAPVTNEQRARAYLKAIEDRVSEEEMADFFAPEVILVQFPNRLVPKVVESTLADIRRESAQGKKSVLRQAYTVRNVVASDDWVVPVIKVVPIRNGKKKKDDFFGRLKGIIEIVGDPDDLIKPVFPLEDYDMLK
jgi:hypothetical protein